MDMAALQKTNRLHGQPGHRPQTILTGVVSEKLHGQRISDNPRRRGRRRRPRQLPQHLGITSNLKHQSQSLGELALHGRRELCDRAQIDKNSRVPRHPMSQVGVLVGQGRAGAYDRSTQIELGGHEAGVFILGSRGEKHGEDVLVVRLDGHPRDGSRETVGLAVLFDLFQLRVTFQRGHHAQGEDAVGEDQAQGKRVGVSRARPV